MSMAAPEQPQPSQPSSSSGDKEMISKKWKLATVLGVAGALALSVASAEARTHRPADARAQAVEGPYAYDPGFHPQDGYRGDGMGYFGTGTYSDGREVPGTNWNPNQN
jgi:hypothetical protein